jgi:hypothetical protein
MIMAFPPEKLGAIAQEVSALLKEKEKTVAVAETVRALITFTIACT